MSWTLQVNKSNFRFLTVLFSHGIYLKWFWLKKLRVYLKVGGVSISPDCSKIYTCTGSTQLPVTENRTACHMNAKCENVNNQPVCTCNQGFTGNGYNCSFVPDSCKANYCYSYGDPHYRTEVKPFKVKPFEIIR